AKFKLLFYYSSRIVPYNELKSGTSLSTNVLLQTNVQSDEFPLYFSVVIADDQSSGVEYDKAKTCSGLTRSFSVDIKKAGSTNICAETKNNIPFLYLAAFKINGKTYILSASRDFDVSQLNDPNYASSLLNKVSLTAYNDDLKQI